MWYNTDSRPQKKSTTGHNCAKATSGCSQQSPSTHYNIFKTDFFWYRLRHPSQIWKIGTGRVPPLVVEFLEYRGILRGVSQTGEVREFHNSSFSGKVMKYKAILQIGPFTGIYWNVFCSLFYTNLLHYMLVITSLFLFVFIQWQVFTAGPSGLVLSQHD